MKMDKRYAQHVIINVVYVQMVLQIVLLVLMAETMIHHIVPVRMENMIYRTFQLVKVKDNSYNKQIVIVHVQDVLQVQRIAHNALI